MTSTGAVVVIGVGNEFRGDDGAGPAVLARLRGELPAEVAVLLSDGEPASLVEAWTGASTAIVVDAVDDGRSEPGALYRAVVGQPAAAGAPRPATPAADQGAASSHGLGLATAIGLADALDRMPSCLILHGIQGADFGRGHGLSTPVDAGLGALAAAILADVGAALG